MVLTSVMIPSRHGIGNILQENFQEKLGLHLVEILHFKFSPHMK